MRNKTEADHVDLICVYVESAESSTQDIASGGLFKTNYIPELTQITAGRIVLHIFLLLLLILTFALGWADDNFGMVSFDEIVFHINMPLEGTATNLLQDFMRQAVLRGFLVWLVLMALVHFPSGKAIEIRTKLEDGREKWFWIFPVRLPLVLLSAFSAVWFCWLFFTVDAKFSVVDYVKSQLQNSTLIEKESDLCLCGICGILHAGHRKRRAF